MFLNPKLPWQSLDIKGPTDDPSNLLGPDQQYACGVLPQVYKDMGANQTLADKAGSEFMMSLGATLGLHEPVGYVWPLATLTVHGDPMAKRGGESVGTHFWMRSGQMTPLLTWESPTGRKMKLMGMTFERPNSGNQWFKQLVISAEGADVLDVSAELTNLGTTKMLIDGGRTYAGGVRSSKLPSTSRSGVTST